MSALPQDDWVAVCAWCGRIRDPNEKKWIHEESDLSLCLDQTTHGICPRCFREMLEEMGGS